MIQKLTVQGLEVTYGTVYEDIRRADSFMNENVLHTIGTITSAQLALAGKDETVCAYIRQLDIAVIGEPEILRAGGVDSSQRLREIRNHDFFREFMARLMRFTKTVYLLSADREVLTHFKAFLSEEYEQLAVVGEAALEESIDDPDAIVNNINAAGPEVVLSVLPSPEAEYFLAEHGRKLGARLWYGIGDFEKMHKKVGFFTSFFRRIGLK